MPMATCMLGYKLDSRHDTTCPVASCRVVPGGIWAYACIVPSDMSVHGTVDSVYRSGWI